LGSATSEAREGIEKRGSEKVNKAACEATPPSALLVRVLQPALPMTYSAPIVVVFVVTAPWWWFEVVV